MILGCCILRARLMCRSVPKHQGKGMCDTSCAMLDHLTRQSFRLSPGLPL